jgi:predicted Zn finger-like uncharacterized protein
MIITCKCGKYEFEVSKNEIPKEGRNVQCGVCNETWFQTPYEKKNKITEVSPLSFSLIRTTFYLLLFILTLAGIMNMLKDYLITNVPETTNYYLFVSHMVEQIVKYISNLLIFLGIQY